MDTRGGGAVVLARAQGYLIVLVAELGIVRIRGVKLEVGPFASPDLIATIACRRGLEYRGIFGEVEVANDVEAHGYSYHPEPWLAAQA